MSAFNFDLQSVINARKAAAAAASAAAAAAAAAATAETAPANAAAAPAPKKKPAPKKRAAVEAELSDADDDSESDGVDDDAQIDGAAASVCREDDGIVDPPIADAGALGDAVPPALQSVLDSALKTRSAAPLTYGDIVERLKRSPQHFAEVIAALLLEAEARAQRLQMQELLLRAIRRLPEPDASLVKQHMKSADDRAMLMRAETVRLYNEQRYPVPPVVGRGVNSCDALLGYTSKKERKEAQALSGLDAKAFAALPFDEHPIPDSVAADGRDNLEPHEIEALRADLRRKRRDATALNASRAVAYAKTPTEAKARAMLDVSRRLLHLLLTEVPALTALTYVPCDESLLANQTLQPMYYTSAGGSSSRFVFITDKKGWKTFFPAPMAEALLRSELLASTRLRGRSVLDLLVVGHAITSRLNSRTGIVAAKKVCFTFELAHVAELQALLVSNDITDAAKLQASVERAFGFRAPLEWCQWRLNPRLKEAPKTYSSRLPKPVPAAQPPPAQEPGAGPPPARAPAREPGADPPPARAPAREAGSDAPASEPKTAEAEAPEAAAAAPAAKATRRKAAAKPKPNARGKAAASAAAQLAAPPEEFRDGLIVSAPAPDLEASAAPLLAVVTQRTLDAARRGNSVATYESNTTHAAAVALPQDGADEDGADQAANESDLRFVEQLAAELQWPKNRVAHQIVKKRFPEHAASIAADWCLSVDGSGRCAPMELTEVEQAHFDDALRRLRAAAAAADASGGAGSGAGDGRKPSGKTVKRCMLTMQSIRGTKPAGAQLTTVSADGLGSHNSVSGASMAVSHELLDAMVEADAVEPRRTLNYGQVCELHARVADGNATCEERLALLHTHAALSTYMKKVLLEQYRRAGLMPSDCDPNNVMLAGRVLARDGGGYMEWLVRCTLMQLELAQAVERINGVYAPDYKPVPLAPASFSPFEGWRAEPPAEAPSGVSDEKVDELAAKLRASLRSLVGIKSQ